MVRGCLGNLVEWYDWFVYASFSIYFAASFFPEGNLRQGKLLRSGTPTIMSCDPCG
ncbi:hypothetical protein [Amycolatopsis lurida]|uniref:hypothetical protein n=1 Tax=Amycolatopsis lurida TaxID=31959 RepID=UPI003657BA1B